MLLRKEAAGPVQGRDRDYDADGVLVEERIVVVRAQNSKAAANRVRKIIAKEQIRFRNTYGQTVRSRLLKGWRSYELYDPPTDGAEVFSDTHRFGKATSDAEITRMLIVAELSEAAQRKRKRFIAADLAKGLEAIWKRRRPPRR